MATELHLPQEVSSAIGQRIRQAELASIADFPQTSKDEDTIVGSFGNEIGTGSGLRFCDCDKETAGASTSHSYWLSFEALDFSIKRPALCLIQESL